MTERQTYMVPPEVYCTHAPKSPTPAALHKAMVMVTDFARERGGVYPCIFLI